MQGALLGAGDLKGPVLGTLPHGEISGSEHFNPKRKQALCRLNGTLQEQYSHFNHI